MVAAEVVSLAGALLSAAVTAGASRHVAVSVAHTLFQACLSRKVGSELQARLDVIAPVLQDHIAAAVENRPTSVPGGRRAQRNVAENDFSEGWLESLATPTAAKRRQRGERRRQQHLGATPSGSPDDSNRSVAAEEHGEPHQ